VAAATAAGTIGALLLLVPWPLALLHADGPSLGLLPRSPLPLGDVLRFHTGASGAGLLPWGLLIAAALPLITATGERLVWAGRAWLLVAASFALTWVPSRVSPSLSVPTPGGVLVPAALGIAIAIGIGVAAFVDELQTLEFGWRQVGAIVAVLGLLAPVPGALGDALGGSWRLPGGDWNAQLSWMSLQHSSAAFRVLWIGDPSVLPLDGAVTHGLGYGLSRNGPPDARALWPAPGGHAGKVTRDAVSLLATAHTARLGHVLAPLGVRYVAVIDRAAPGAHRVDALPRGLTTTLGEQLDLSMRQAESGLTLYENAAWLPTRAITAALPAGGNPTADALASNITARPLVADRAPGSGTLFVSEAHDSRWRATQDGHALPNTTAFGWANAYPLRGAGGAVHVRFHGGSARTIALVLQLLLWLALLGFLLVAASRRRAAKATT
jgi:hypothetical protein